MAWLLPRGAQLLFDHVWLASTKKSYPFSISRTRKRSSENGLRQAEGRRWRMEKKVVLALDQGTTSSRAILFDRQGRVVHIAQKELTQHYPKPGWVEHNPMEIWGAQSGVAREVLEAARVRPQEVAAIGITNQRETTVVWERHTGEPVHPAIVWQDRRTADLCERLKKDGWEPVIREKTGLIIDAYFSATKLK